MSYNTAEFVQVSLHVENCYVCGTPFGIQSALWAHIKKKGKAFYCPAGHCITTGEGTESKRIRELEERAERLERMNRAERESREHTERQLRAQKGNVTKLKKRAAAGVCPCCKRSFQNLKRHMDSKHPDYASGDKP